MVNFKQLQPLPFRETLSPEEEQLVTELQENRATLSAINRLTYRIRRTIDRTEPGQGFVLVVDIQEEFPLVAEQHFPKLVRFFELKGLTVHPKGRAGTFSFTWEVS